MDAKAVRGIHLSDRQRLAWLRLIRSENVGPITFRDLINHYGSADAAIEALPELARRGGASGKVRIASVAEAERELERAARYGAEFVGIGEPGYPPLLRSIGGAPPLLAVKGTLDVTARPAVAVVGSRNASAAGAKLTARFATDLGRAGYTIVSGLARGIDAAAHRASLATGTIAAMAGGLDQPYPPENLPLFEAICHEGGLAISEMPFGWEPRARDFPRRNRLVAGCALGLVVMEAAVRSGSLISARRAADFGRLVFAVPGSPIDPRAAGTNQLLKDGATLVTSAEDIVEALAPLSPGMARPAHAPAAIEEDGQDNPIDDRQPDDSERAQIVAALGAAPVEIDDVIAHTGLAPAAVYLVLLELDLAGRLDRHPGGRVSLSVADL